MGACRHCHHASIRTRGDGRCPHVQKVHATNSVSLHHHLLGCVQKDDFSPTESSVESKIIKFADGNEVGGEVRCVYSCFEGQVYMVAIIYKCAFDFAYTQNAESTIFICSAASMWGVICNISGKVPSIREAVVR